MSAPQDCDRCPALVSCRTQVVNGKGQDHAKLMIVGQNPGYYEDRDGAPFVGKSGKLLRIMLESAHLNSANVWRTNAVRCLTPGNRKPSRKETDACRDYLIEEIKEHKPKVIITLGDTPLQALYGSAAMGPYFESIAEWELECLQTLEDWEANVDIWQGEDRKTRGLKPKRPKLPHKPLKPKGSVVTLTQVVGHTLMQPETQIPIVPSYHPAFLMRGKWDYLPLVVAHFEKAKRLLDAL